MLSLSYLIFLLGKSTKKQQKFVNKNTNKYRKLTKGATKLWWVFCLPITTMFSDLTSLLGKSTKKNPKIMNKVPQRTKMYHEILVSLSIYQSQSRLVIWPVYWSRSRGLENLSNGKIRNMNICGSWKICSDLCNLTSKYLFSPSQHPPRYSRLTIVSGWGQTAGQGNWKCVHGKGRVILNLDYEILHWNKTTALE